jgi:mono/diheme cytochrome c family protein
MRRFVVALVVLLVVSLAAVWLVTMPQMVTAAALGPHQPDVENGKTMFRAGGCPACHASPEQPDDTLLGGGRSLKSPFGTFFAPNISPDPQDGIGTWTEAQFVTAMATGTALDGRHYYPVFPYPSYQHMKVDDLRDLFAYLKTLPSTEGNIAAGKSRDHEVPFPFNIRRLIGLWKLLFLDGQPIRPDPGQTAQWNRGAYLVNGPGHCAECHSPRNVLGGIIKAQRFAGGPNPEGEGWIPNITQKALGNWSVDDIAEVLTSGDTPDDRVGGAMLAVVRNTSQLSAEDRDAIALYIKSLPPVEGPTPPKSN